MYPSCVILETISMVELCKQQVHNGSYHHVIQKFNQIKIHTHSFSFSICPLPSSSFTDYKLGIAIYRSAHKYFPNLFTSLTLFDFSRIDLCQEQAFQLVMGESGSFKSTLFSIPTDNKTSLLEKSQFLSSTNPFSLLNINQAWTKKSVITTVDCLK